MPRVFFDCLYVIIFRYDDLVVRASGSGQLQANPHVSGPLLSPGKSTSRAVSTIGSNDLVVGEDYMLEPRYRLYNWKTGMCGSIAFGISPRKWKTLISNPRCLAELSTCGKSSGDILEEKSGVEPLKAV